jgi:hypothetical protein
VFLNGFSQYGHSRNMVVAGMLIDWVNGMVIPEGKGGKRNKEKEGIAKR